MPKNKNIVGASEWKSDLKKFDDVTVPELKGCNASANVVKALPIGEEDQVVTVNYVSQAKSVHATKANDANHTPHMQTAIISFIDIDNSGALITSSGELTGQPGESINDIYSTEVPLRVLKQSGYKVVFDNFDAPGVIQRFDNNDLLPQVFTIGLKKVAQDEPSLKLVDNQQQ